MKKLFYALIICLTMYAPIELTRYIIIHPAFQTDRINLAAEMAFYWVCYICALLIIWKFMKVDWR